MQEFYQMSPSDTSLSVTCQLPITEEHPIHSGTTDHTLLPPSVVPWTSRTPKHRVALARAMSIKDRLAEHGMGFDDDDVKKVFVKKSASQIVDHLAGMLNGLCPQACDQRKKTFHMAIEIEMTLGDLIDFAHLVRADSVNAMVDSVARACALRADPGASNRLQTIFRDTARMTVCNPVILTNMVRSASFGQMCSTIPSGLRQAVGLDVVHAANAYAKPVAPPPVVEKIEMDPWGRAKRIASAICNLDALGGIEIVVD
ncbi:hypothetical protein KKH24_04150 [Patescibacteria group bacterium]|nr:hypothetical protein [Patescibacteria group bacterium]